MDKYVSKEIAIERIKRVKPHVVMSEYGVGYERGLKDAIGILNATPSADVQPVKRGFWKALMMSEETGWDLSLTCGHDTVCEYVCSVCGKPNIVDEFGDSYLPNFCPNCGARLDLKDGDEE